MRKYFVKIESPTFELCVSAWCSFCSFLAFLENLSFTKPNLTFSYLKKTWINGKKHKMRILLKLKSYI